MIILSYTAVIFAVPNFSLTHLFNTPCKRLFQDLAELEALVAGLDVIRRLVSADPRLLAKRPRIGLALRLLWRSPARTQRLSPCLGPGLGLPSRLEEETPLLASLLISALRYTAPEEAVSPLLELAAACAPPLLTDLGFLRDFLTEEVNLTFSSSSILIPPSL